MYFYLFAILLILIYTSLIVTLYLNWHKKVNSFSNNKSHSFSIVIPARNESSNIVRCIESILENNYDCEIIVVDDHSTDETVALVSKFKDVLVLINTGTGKKDALSSGISMASNEYIITLDADCIVKETWLKSINDHLNKYKQDLVTGPIKFINTQTPSQWVEVYDFLALMAVTAYGINEHKFYLANGANLIFKKELFDRVGGYTGNETMASGDDVFLINKAVQSNFNVGFMKNINGAVLTYSQPDFKSLLNQRKRWATKSKAYASSGILAIQTLVFCISLFIISGLISFFINKSFFYAAVFLFLIKLLVDFIFLRKMKGIFYENNKMPHFLSSSFLYLFLIIYMGISAILPSTYEWKNRTVK